MRILVVEDRQDLRDALEMCLGDYGHDITLAEDGREALELVHAQSFDLIITDVEMPNMDGIELTRAVRKVSSIPILSWSGRMPKYEDQLAQAGADWRLDKPEYKGLMDIVQLVAQRQAA